MSMEGLSRVSLVSALKAKPRTVTILPSSVLNSSETMLWAARQNRRRRGMRALAEREGGGGGGGEGKTNGKPPNLGVV
jgi:hypothetical protein